MLKVKQMQMSWPEYLAGFAEHAATKSKDSTQVGCMLFDKSRFPISAGFNGPAIGVQDLPERFERPAKYLWCSHAEENAIASAARRGASTEGATAYVTHMPCARCARLLIQAGVSRVVAGSGKTSMPVEEFDVARTMFGEAGVILEENLA